MPTPDRELQPAEALRAEQEAEAEAGRTAGRTAERAAEQDADIDLDDARVGPVGRRKR